jgi:hypothetical protein
MLLGRCQSVGIRFRIAEPIVDGLACYPAKNGGTVDPQPMTDLH